MSFEGKTTWQKLAMNVDCNVIANFERFRCKQSFLRNIQIHLKMMINLIMISSLIPSTIVRRGTLTIKIDDKV